MQQLRLAALLVALPLLAWARSLAPVVSFTPQQSVEHKLPALGISFQPPGDLQLQLFPEPDVYLGPVPSESSGPTRDFALLAAPELDDTAPALRAFVEARVARRVFDGRVRTALTFGQPFSVTVARHPRRALGFFAGESLARAEFCCVHLPPRPGARGGAVLLLAASAGPKRQKLQPEQLFEKFAPALDTLVITPAAP